MKWCNCLQRAVENCSCPPSAAPPAAAGELYVIRKRGYFYRPNANGYTSDVSKAWRVPYDVAKLHEEPNDEPVTIHKLSEFENAAPPAAAGDVDKLMERLRRTLSDLPGDDEALFAEIHEQRNAAATAFAAMQARVGELEGLLCTTQLCAEKIINQRDAARARIAALEEALTEIASLDYKNGAVNMAALKAVETARAALAKGEVK